MLKCQWILKINRFHPYSDIMAFPIANIFILCVLLQNCRMQYQCRVRRGRDRMVVGFITTYAISDYHCWYCEFESQLRRGVQHYVINFVSDLLQVSSFLRVLRFPPPIKKTDRHDITEILLKVALNTKTITKPYLTWKCSNFCIIENFSEYWIEVRFMMCYVTFINTE